MRAVAAVALVMAPTSAAGAQSPPRQSITTDANATLPFSPAVKAGGFIYVAGPVGDGTTPLAKGDIRAQTKQMLDAVAKTLKAAGSSLANAASVTVYLRNVSAFAAMNEVYATYFPANPPARTTVVVSQPPASADGLVEIAMVAVKDASRTAVTTPNADGTPGRPSANLSGAIRVGNRLYLSGITGSAPDNRGNVGAQATEVLARVGRTLHAAGFTWADVVDSTVFMSDMTRFADMNTVYRTAMTKDFPARATVGLSPVGGDTLVEMMFVAVR